jgi:hypothetical protein
VSTAAPTPASSGGKGDRRGQLPSAATPAAPSSAGAGLPAVMTAAVKPRSWPAWSSTAYAAAEASQHLVVLPPAPPQSCPGEASHPSSPLPGEPASSAAGRAGAANAADPTPSPDADTDASAPAPTPATAVLPSCPQGDDVASAVLAAVAAAEGSGCSVQHSRGVRPARLCMHLAFVPRLPSELHESRVHQVRWRSTAGFWRGFSWVHSCWLAMLACLSAWHGCADF